MKTNRIPSGKWFVSVILMSAIFVGAADSPTSDTNSPLLINHLCADISKIPEEWIEKAKDSLHIAYGFTSHGSQIATGMTGLARWKGPLFAWNPGGNDGALDLRAYHFNFGGLNIAHDLGNPDRTAWEKATRIYLGKNPEINVVVWAWCWQHNGSEGDIKLYLDLMTKLEKDYPQVMFVYMTGRLSGEPPSGKPWEMAVTRNNKQIRDYCLKKGKILYDFADIESYDPDGSYFGDKRANDNCDYDSDGDGTRDRNWAIDWQNAHPGEWYECDAAHTQPLNANLKAYAAWWLWARLAGWDGK